MLVRSQSGEKKSTVGVNDCFGVPAVAIMTSRSKSICILLLLPQPPAAASAAMVESELADLGVVLTSRLKNIGVVKYGPVAVVTAAPSVIAIAPSSVIAPAPPSVRSVAPP